jgi:exosortase
MIFPGRISSRDFFGWLVLLALAGWLFHGTFAGLFGRWWDDPTYAHGFLVPLASAFFVYEALRRNRDIEVGGSLWGAPVLAAAILAFFAGKLGNMLFIQAIAFIVSLAALALLVEGWAFFKVTVLPIGFLVFMCPLPSGFYDMVSARLRLFASGVSTVLLQMAGVPATASGNIIYIPNATLSVEDACSGIRSLFGIIATATAFAFVVRGGFLRKAVFILSAAPIAVFANILRVTGTGFLQNAGYSRLAEGFYHQVEGWMFYVIALAALLGEYAVLKAVFPISAEEDGGGAGGHAGTGAGR